MKAAYRRYRGYGHTRFAAATLAVPFWLFYGSLVPVSYVLTLWLAGML